MSSDPNYNTLETLYIVGEFEKVIIKGKEFLASCNNDPNKDIFLIIQTLILVSYSYGYRPESEASHPFFFLRNQYSLIHSKSYRKEAERVWFLTARAMTNMTGPLSYTIKNLNQLRIDLDEMKDRYMSVGKCVEEIDAGGAEHVLGGGEEVDDNKENMAAMERSEDLGGLTLSDGTEEYYDADEINEGYGDDVDEEQDGATGLEAIEDGMEKMAF
jgi:hypothetical protein